MPDKINLREIPNARDRRRVGDLMTERRALHFTIKTCERDREDNNRILKDYLIGYGVKSIFMDEVGTATKRPFVNKTIKKELLIEALDQYLTVDQIAIVLEEATCITTTESVVFTPTNNDTE
jgi:hypothetical protein